jgi:hypothetical protein
VAQSQEVSEDEGASNTDVSDDTDTTQEQTTLPDNQTPLAGGDAADTVGGLTSVNLIILILSSALFLATVIIGGWLLLRHTRY